MGRGGSGLRRRGATAVEFAIVSPIFFVLVIAAFEFGRLNVIRHTADNAAYEAARRAMVPGATVAEATTEAQRILRIVGTRGATVNVTPATLGPDVDRVTVTVDVPMNQNGWITPRFTRSTNIRATSTLRTERARD
jgi:Flp pilus assembly protein TadG